MRIGQIHSIEEQKLNELISPLQNKLKKTDWELNELTNWLESKGFEKLGLGAYATVYWFPGSSNVIKVSRQEDQCWLAYAAFSQHMNKQGRNPFLPKVHWIKKFGKDNQLFLTMIEKLEPMRIDDPNRSSAIFSNTNNVGVLAYLFATDPWRFGHEMNPLTQRLADEGIIDPDVTNLGNEENIKMATEYYKNDTAAMTFAKTLKKLKQWVADNGIKCIDDLHAGNIMYRRSTGSIVITDPIA